MTHCPACFRCFPPPPHLIQMNGSLSAHCRAWWRAGLIKATISTVPLLCMACSHRIRSRSLVQASFTSWLTACSVYVSWLFLFLNQISKHKPLSPLFWVMPMSDVYIERNMTWSHKAPMACFSMFCGFISSVKMMYHYPKCPQRLKYGVTRNHLTVSRQGQPPHHCANLRYTGHLNPS